MKSESDNPSLPLPKDPRHQRFADLVLSGAVPADAYKKAGFTAKTTASRATGASRMLKNADIVRYMAAIRQQAARGSVMDLQERREFYARIVRTPIMSIKPSDESFKDGDLLKKVKFGESGWEIEKLDPLKACELDTKAAGEDPESNAIAELAAALGSLAGGTLPAGKL